MLSKKMEKELNSQLNAELYSAYLYLSMSAHFESTNLKGFASWMRVQALEERDHAMKFFDFIHERGGKVLMQPIDGPPTSWKSFLNVFQETYKHEQLVTKLINKLVDLAAKEKDHATNNFLQWFVTEQVEEEASADETVQQLKLVGSQGHGIFMIDRELGQRVYTPAPGGVEG